LPPCCVAGNLGKHLNNRHPGYDQLAGHLQGDPTQSTISSMFARDKKPHPPTRARVQSPPQLQPHSQVQVQVQAQPKVLRAQPKPKPAVDPDWVNWLLLRWLISSSFPPSSLEDSGFVDSCRYLNPAVRLWPKEKAQEITLQVFRSMKEDVRASLQRVRSRLSIALNFWTSYEQIVYLSVKCHWIDENWVSRNVLLDVCRIRYQCTGTEILRVMLTVLREFNIDLKILACTHNNSQHAIHACHELRRELESRKLPFCYIPCAARTLEIIIENGLKHVQPLLSKTREFILEINSNQEMMEDFKHWTEVYQEGSWKLPFDHSVTWNGNYNMLDVVKKVLYSTHLNPIFHHGRISSVVHCYRIVFL
jgi:hypothetical protein